MACFPEARGGKRSDIFGKSNQSHARRFFPLPPGPSLTIPKIRIEKFQNKNPRGSVFSNCYCGTPTQKISQKKRPPGERRPQVLPKHAALELVAFGECDIAHFVRGRSLMASRSHHIDNAAKPRQCPEAAALGTPERRSLTSAVPARLLIPLVGAQGLDPWTVQHWRHDRASAA